MVIPKIVWVTRSFLDYRIPVFEALDHLVEGQLYLLFSADYVPESVQKKAVGVLGDRAVGLSGEWKLGAEDQHFMANSNISLRYQPGLIQKIRRLNPDVLVCDGFFKWTFSALIGRLFFRVPLVINYERTFHTERNVQWYRTRYRKMVLRVTDAMDCSGRLSVEYSRSLGMPSEKITTGHMTADTDLLSQRASRVTDEETRELRHRLDIQGVLFLYVGRLHARKGCDQLIRAWEHFIGDETHQATLLLVGPDEVESKTRVLCQAGGCHNIQCIGAVAYDEIALYYRSADVFLISTLEDNWSLVVPEAMACGLPIICSTYNGCWPELVHEGRNGWVFDPLDQGDFQRVLKTCQAHQESLEEMGKISQEIIAQYGPESGARSILEACQLALNHRKTDTVRR